MLILPPQQEPVRPERRGRDRRVTDRRRAAKTTSAPEAEAAPRASVVEPEVETTEGPQFRARGRGPGRRRSDRDADGDAATARVGKPHAPLVAQLIATALNLEQTRVKRRGSPDDAAALYGRKAERAKRSRGEA